MLDLSEFLLLGITLFCIGVFGVLVRKNVLVILMSIELMLNAVNIILVAFSHYMWSVEGQVIALLVFIVAGAEAAVGLGIITTMYRKTLDVLKWRALRG